MAAKRRLDYFRPVVISYFETALTMNTSPIEPHAVFLKFLCRVSASSRCSVTSISASLLIVGALFVGLAQAALQPLWEGFDDPGHFSYIKQLVEKRSLPKYRDRLSGEIAEYFSFAPGSSNLASRWTYEEFFAGAGDNVERVRSWLHSTRDRTNDWQDDKIANWEAQQPPLYYLVLAPLYNVSKAWSRADQMYLLRCASYALAWIGLVLAALYWLRDRKNADLIPVPALWPLFFPMWFPEMA
jgi:hypothetical protein